MRLGLLADIHEEVDHLDACVAALRERGVDRFVVLGDVFELGPRLTETVRRLAALDSVGVWGNHDFGLCRDVPDLAREMFPPDVLAYFASLLPRAEVAGCLFQHIEPHLDPEDFADLWSYGGDGRLAADGGLAAVPHRRVFIGHLHRWLARTPTRRLEWAGDGPITLPDEQTLVVVHAVRQGWCGWYDTDTGVLEPIRVG